MSFIDELFELSSEEQVLVATAVLLDGREGYRYLENDSRRGDVLGKLAAALGALAPELRLALAASLVRTALAECK